MEDEEEPPVFTSIFSTSSSSSEPRAGIIQNWSELIPISYPLDELLAFVV
jgi:hypothetical protein